MGGFFSIEGPFYRFGSILADIMILSVLWLLFMIPVFTIGASTSAMFYVATKRISNREGYIFRDFFSSFKQNFKQSTLSWLLIMLVEIIICFNIYYIWLGNLGKAGSYLLPVQICLLVEVFAMSLYIFPAMARFNLKFVDAFKSAFYMANKHFPTTLLCVLLFVGSIFVIDYYPLYIFLAAGVYAYLTSYLFMRVFKKYRPEIDNDDLDTLRSVSN